MGPTTAAAVNEAGFEAIVPEEYTVVGMMEAVGKYFRDGSG